MQAGIFVRQRCGGDRNAQYIPLCENQSCGYIPPQVMLGLELVFCAFCRYPQNQNSCNQTFQIGEYTSRAYATEPLESGNEFEFADAKDNFAI